ncbi:MAG: hypothetical protein AB9834_00240 [Lentimicrobium sp.]
MVNHNVEYRNGHFYLEDGSRLVLSERQYYTLSGVESSFSTHDEMLDTKSEPRAPEVLKDVLESKYGKENLIIMLPARSEFHFNLGLGKRKNGVQERGFTFEGLLEEDLYLRLLPGRTIETPESWVVAECITSITKCTSKNFNLEQKVSEETPGKAFALLVSTHFSQQRGTGISIYNYFKTRIKENDRRDMKIAGNIKTFGQVREMVLQQNLEEIRELQEKKKKELAHEELKKALREKAIKALDALRKENSNRLSID